MNARGGINGRRAPFLFPCSSVGPCCPFFFSLRYFFHPSTYTTISTVISLHCPPADSIPFDSAVQPMEKVERGSEFSSKHRCILFLLSLFHPVLLVRCFAVASIPSISSPSFLPLLLLHRSPSLVRAIVGVNLSPRLSPNPELYKLKPISLPGHRSSYSKPLYFRLFVVGKHARSSSRRSARTRCLATTLTLLPLHPHTLSFSHSRSSIHAPTNSNAWNFAHAYTHTRGLSSLLCTTVCGCGSLIRIPCDPSRIFTRLSDIACTLLAQGIVISDIFNDEKKFTRFPPLSTFRR